MKNKIVIDTIILVLLLVNVSLVTAFWFAWYAFYPRTDIWRGE